MRRAAVRHGDPTTTRGFVMAYSSTFHDDGKKIALSGDEATCGNCKGAFKIYGTGKGISENGRDAVLDGDPVLCPCGKNRVIVGDNPGIFLTTNEGSAVAKSAAGGFSIA
jgi:PAAR motif